MKKIVLLAGAVLALSASMASAGGINLSWNDCQGPQNITSTCLNTGSAYGLVGSFDPAVTLPEFLGIAAQVDITTDQAALPDWWKHGTGQCRGTTALATSFDAGTSPTCNDVYFGQAAGGFAYDVGFGTPARARFRIQAAVPVDNRIQVDAGTEYFAFKANIQRAKSTGTGSCAGCANSTCIVLNSIQLFQPLEQNNDPEIFNPRERNFVTFQSPVNGPVGCPLSTPTQSKTWGQVKSLYR